jgi:hypothetical protein
MEVTKPRIAEAFGESGAVVEFAGRTIVVRYLDINDLIEIERRIGSLDGIDQTNFDHLRFLFWLIFRKGDPLLSDADLTEQNYSLSEKQAGVGLTMKALKSKAAADLLREIMIGSGLVDEETDDPNAALAAEQ